MWAFCRPGGGSDGADGAAPQGDNLTSMVAQTVLVLRLAAGAPAPAPVAPPAYAFGAPLAPALAPALLAPAAPDPAPAAPAPAAAPLDLSRAAGVYERRKVGLLALDAKDSTALHLSEGTRRAHALIRDAVDGAESAASAFDGRVIRRLGDGSLIAFPSYAAALGAAEAIQRGNAARGEKVPALRVGVHAGRVLVDATGPAPEIYGRAVETTLALAASADGGAVAADPGPRPAPAAPARAPDAPRPVDSVRVERAATMFASLDGWTTAYERYGRRRAYSAVKAFHAHVRDCVERHGGLVVKTEGETVMATFPSAEAGVKAAADIQARLEDLRAAAPLGRLFRPRVGLSWGRVIREERAGELDYFGNTVNAAARMMKLSGDGEAVIGGSADGEPGVAALVEGAARETARLKGFSDPVPVLRLKPAPRPRDAKASARLREAAAKARRAIVPAPDAR